MYKDRDSDKRKFVKDGEIPLETPSSAINNKKKLTGSVFITYAPEMDTERIRNPGATD